MNPVEVVQGDSPLILGLPHTGTYLPETIRAKLNARGRILADTDWHIERLYDGLLPNVTTVRATFHRSSDGDSDESCWSMYFRSIARSMSGESGCTSYAERKPLTSFTGTARNRRCYVSSSGSAYCREAPTSRSAAAKLPASQSWSLCRK